MATYGLIDNFQAEVDARLKEQANILDDADKQRLIKSALTTYSRHRPDTAANDITGDTGFDYSVDDTNFPAYVEGFSSITAVEYPYDSTDAVPNTLESEDWIVYDGPSGQMLRLLNSSPAVTETIRVHFSIPYAFSANAVTLPDTDFYAICDLATAYVLRAIASKYIATGASSIGVDAVAYRSKAREAMDLAKVYEGQYESQLGITEGAQIRGASVVLDWDTEYSFQADWLTHPGRWF
jgi:hypothetical protein